MVCCDPGKQQLVSLGADSMIYIEDLASGEVRQLFYESKVSPIHSHAILGPSFVALIDSRWLPFPFFLARRRLLGFHYQPFWYNQRP